LTGPVTGPVTVAAALVVDVEGRVLVVRQRGGPFRGSWLFPGGRAEPGESAAETVRREGREETGVAFVEARPLASYEVRSADFQAVLHVFQGVLAAGALAAEEGSALLWVAPNDPRAHPAVRVVLAEHGLLKECDVDRELRDLGIEMRRVARGSAGGSAVASEASESDRVSLG
jgi:8-oxo-dGTP diphosphatase